MSDWLDIAPEVESLPVPVELPSEPAARVALAEQCWAQLSDKQRTALTVFRDNRLSARRAEEYGGVNRRTHRNWVNGNLNYATIVRLWMGVAGSEALDKDRLLARQDDIVETLLEPKYVLHQGLPVFDPTRPGEHLKEVNAGAASKANETLMRAAGLLKDKEIEVNVGVFAGPPTLNIQVMPTRPSQTVARENVAIDAKFTELPAPEEDWPT